MFTLIQTSLRRGIAHAKALRRFPLPAIFLSLLLLFPVAALAQSGSPFDTGFTALQNLFTGTVAKVASLIAIVIGGYQFAHGEPGSKKYSFFGILVPQHLRASNRRGPTRLSNSLRSG
jgi:type IV secretory pathway VirB2 component (pilin)